MSGQAVPGLDVPLDYYSPARVGFILFILGVVCVVFCFTPSHSLYTDVDAMMFCAMYDDFLSFLSLSGEYDISLSNL